MNNKIKQLAEQAGIQDNPDQEGLELFANLIVQECLAQIDKNFVGAVGTYPGAYNTGVKKCQNIIKQHFGLL